MGSVLERGPLMSVLLDVCISSLLARSWCVGTGHVAFSQYLSCGAANDKMLRCFSENLSDAGCSGEILRLCV